MPDPKRRPKSSPNTKAEMAAWRQRMGGWSAGIDFAAVAVVSLLIGLGIDYFAGTGPLFLVIFLCVGVVGGFTAFVRTGMRLNRGPKR